MEPLTTTYITKEIIEAFGGEDNILALPRFQIDNSNFGMLRDYPDFIKYDDVTDPIMIGVDKYRRTFIVFKFGFVLPNKTLKITTVLFQRYTDSSYWTSASNPPGNYHIMGEGGLNLPHYDILKKVLTDGRLNNVHNIYTGDTGDYVLANYFPNDKKDKNDERDERDENDENDDMDKNDNSNDPEFNIQI